MRKALIIAGLLIAFVAGVAFAQTVTLFPSVSVTAEQRASAVWAVCYLDGYEGDWEDGPAMWAFYRQRLVKRMRHLYQIAKMREAREALPAAESYDPGYGGAE